MLLKKMLRDMKNNKTQFVSIFLMAFLAVFIYAGIGGEWVGLQHTLDNYYSDTNMANVWIYGNMTQENADAVNKLEDVKDVERTLVLDTVGDFSENPSIQLRFIEKHQISKSYLVEGEEFDVDKDGIWLDKRFTDARKIQLGDMVTLNYNEMKITKEVKGIIYSPEYVYIPDDGGISIDFSKKGYAYLSYKQFPVPDKLVYNKLLVTTDSKDYVKLEAEINNALSGKYSVFLSREQNESSAMFQQEIEQHKSIGQLFPVIFVAIALLTMLTTMTRLVNNQRIQIGTLKALGFKKGKITMHYVGYGFWLSLTGAFLGAITGPLALPPLFYPSMSSVYTIPEWKPSIDPSFYIAAIATVIACTLVTYLACRNLLRDTPSETLRPKAPKNPKHNSFEKTKLWHKLGFNIQWNFRDITRNKTRTIMAVVGTFGCTALLVFAFNIYSDMSDLKTWQYEEISQFRTKLTMSEDADQGYMSRLKTDVKGEFLMEGAIEIKANDTKKTGTLTVDDNVTLIKRTDKDRNYITLPEKGISLSYKLAKELGVKTGDEIKWHLYGDEKWTTSKVELIYRSPIDQGIVVEKEYFEGLGYTFLPTSIITKEEVDGKYDGIQTVMQKQDLLDSWEDMVAAMMIMVYLVIAAAAVLAVVVLYNLGILSYTEMEREFATLKVVGFKAKKIRHLLLTQNLALSVIGFILGIPCGKWLVNVMTSTMGDSFDMMVVLHLTDIVFTGIIVTALCVIVNLMFARKIKRLDMVSALKGVE